MLISDCICPFQTLINKLCEEVGVDNLKLNSKVLSLSCSFDGSTPLGSWSISYATNDADTKKLKKDQSFDAVIMTVMNFVEWCNKWLFLCNWQPQCLWVLVLLTSRSLNIVLIQLFFVSKFFCPTSLYCI